MSGLGSSPRGEARRLSVAPMVDYSDRHFRVFMRQLTRRTLLYTPMLTTTTALRPDRRYLLEFDPRERPVALQLGGDDPDDLARAAELAQQAGYDEVDLNLGCPSPRVGRANYGVLLMRQPERVARCLRAMRAAVSLPVTAKIRLGLDDDDSPQFTESVTEALLEAGADRVIVHARKAWTEGLSPKQNRSVPPLRYDRVRALKARFPAARIELNGGVRSLDEALAELAGGVDGVMIGRAAIDDPYLFAEADARVFGEPGPPVSRLDAALGFLPYARVWIDERGEPARYILRHLLNLFAGQPGGKRFRRVLSEGFAAGAGAELLARALDTLPG